MARAEEHPGIVAMATDGERTVTFVASTVNFTIDMEAVASSAVEAGFSGGMDRVFEDRAGGELSVDFDGRKERDWAADAEIRPRPDAGAFDIRAQTGTAATTTLVGVGLFPAGTGSILRLRQYERSW